MLRYDVDVPFQDCYKLPIYPLDSIEEIDAHILTWIKTTLNKKEFLDCQNDINTIKVVNIW